MEIYDKIGKQQKRKCINKYRSEELLILDSYLIIEKYRKHLSPLPFDHKLSELKNIDRKSVINDNNKELFEKLTKYLNSLLGVERILNVYEVRLFFMEH